MTHNFMFAVHSAHSFFPSCPKTKTLRFTARRVLEKGSRADREGFRRFHHMTALGRHMIHHFVFARLGKCMLDAVYPVPALFGIDLLMLALGAPFFQISNFTSSASLTGFPRE